MLTTTWEGKKREGGCRVAVKPRCLNYVAIKGKKFFPYSSSSWKRYSAKATKLTWFYQTGLWESNLSEFIKSEGWLVRDTQYVSKGVYMWARVTVVSCQFHKFPQVRTWFPRKSTVCRSTFYWLLPNSRPNNKGPTAIWQAGLAGCCTWTSQTVCVGANTQWDTSAFSAKWAHTNRDKKCPITLEEREAIITWNSKTKMLTLRVECRVVFSQPGCSNFGKKREKEGVRLRDVKSFLQGPSCKTNVMLFNVHISSQRQ